MGAGPKNYGGTGQGETCRHKSLGWGQFFATARADTRLQTVRRTSLISISNPPREPRNPPLPLTHTPHRLAKMADVQERLKKLGASSRIGGKGTPRRKMKRAPQRSATDDKKLQQALKKLNVQPIQAIEEVNMFKSDGNVIHFAAPKGM